MVIRKEYLDKLWSFKDLDLIKVVTGIRRCGKSTLLEQYQEKLLDSGVDKEQIITINFESLENEEFLDYRKLHEYIKSKLVPNKFTYVFLDEIQKVKDFEKAISSLNIKKNVDIYIAGSNAFLLSGELATYLSGRYIEINLLPLSFKEYYEYVGSNDSNKVFEEYMLTGGLPYLASLRKHNINNIESYLEGIYNTVFVKDIEERQSRREQDSSIRKVTNIALIINLSQHLSSVIGSPVSMNKIADFLSSNGRKISHVTVSEYIHALEESYLFYKIERMDISGKLLLKQNYKYYMVDLGFRNIILPKRNYDQGFSLENIVFFELLRRGYKVNIGKVGNSEIDFVALKDQKYEYYQVCYSLNSEQTFYREIKPLQETNDDYKKIILTKDTFTVGNYNGIEVINIVEWLLRQN